MPLLCRLLLAEHLEVTMQAAELISTALADTHRPLPASSKECFSIPRRCDSSHGRAGADGSAIPAGDPLGRFDLSDLRRSLNA